VTQPPLPDPTEGQNLDERVEWMSYSHQQLYDMVNNGVDLTGANDVAASWAKLSDTLAQMSDALNTALAASTDGWQGPAADQARGNLGGLVSWAHDTGQNAVVVSGCVTRQADALQTARSAMPAPPLRQVVVSPVTTTSAFAQPPVAQPGPITVVHDNAESHQQAARVMQQYQSSSADISRTIPQFALPTNPVSGPAQPPIGNPSGPPTGGSNPNPGPMPVGGLGNPASASAPPSEESSTATPGPRTSSGAAAAASTTSEPEPAQASRGSSMSSAGLGGGAGRREDDREHRRKYWQEDDGLFDLDTRVSPRVIGEEKRD
jgi:hypothetical protein